MKQPPNTIDECPLCGSDNILQDQTTGEAICKSCEYVYQKDTLIRAPSGGPSPQKKDKIKPELVHP